MLFFTVGSQGCRHRLALLARVDKDETFLPARVFKDITEPRIGMFGRRIRRRVKDGERWHLALSLRRLCIADIKMLHGDAPLASLCLDARYDRPPPCPRGEKGTRPGGIADRRRKSDAARRDARDAGQPLNETQRLPTAVAAQERVNLVDDDEAQVAKEFWNRRMTM